MNVTTKGRYALQVMLDLAGRKDESFVSLKSIADRQGISVKYLEAIVGDLKKEGLLEALRGKEGGYRLMKEPGSYSVGEILRCVEENLAPVSCINAGTVNCERAGACMTVPMWKELDDITNNYLDGVSLEDLLTGKKWKG